MRTHSQPSVRVAWSVTLKKTTRLLLGGIVACVLGVAPASLRPVQAVQAAKPKAAANLIRIPYEQYRLSNGLTVVLSEDHTTPTVAVALIYHVGSKNEKFGRTGFAHLFEHVMFTGSGHVPYGMHDRLTEGVGGGNNGATSNDITFYYETVPASYLETALWLESDRMGWLLDALDLTKLNAQRDVVKNERRQRVDNQPYGRVDEIIAAALYPEAHPYSWPVIGSMADLSAASEEDVKEFFRLYYAPNNAVLVIAGDFRQDQAKQWVHRYFGEIPKGKPIQRPKVAPATLSSEKRLVFEDRVQVPRLYVTWPTVGSRNDDQYALDVLGSVLAGSRTARLTNLLVYEKQTATALSASQGTSEDVGQFEIILTPRPGHTLEELERATDEVIARLKREGPTDQEVRKAKAGAELSFLSGLEANLGKAMTLGTGYTFTGNAGHFQTEYRKAQAVTPADVKRVATRYLTHGRIVLSVVPVGKKDQASKAAASTPVGIPASKGTGK